jgi:hypothetical protein
MKMVCKYKLGHHYITQMTTLSSQAMEGNLKMSVHLAEIPNESEVSLLLDPDLDFHPHRIGHGVAIHPSIEGGTAELWKKLTGE